MTILVMVVRCEENAPVEKAYQVNGNRRPWFMTVL